MLSTQEVGRRSQCGYRHGDTPCPYPHGDTETLHTNQTWRHMETCEDTQRHMETCGDARRYTETCGDTCRHTDTETLHRKSVHILKPIFMML